MWIELKFMISRINKSFEDTGTTVVDSAIYFEIHVFFDQPQISTIHITWKMKTDIRNTKKKTPEYRQNIIFYIVTTFATVQK